MNSKTSLTDHPTDRPLPIIDRFILVPNDRIYNAIVMIFYLHKPTTSINRPFKVGPMVGRFREDLHTYMYVHTVKPL